MTNADWTTEIALHEAAHCTALFLEGIKINKVRVWKIDGSVTPASKPSADPFAHAVSLLAGNAFMRSLGLSDDGDSNDFVRASFLVATQFDDRTEAASEAFSIVCEAAEALVRSERFVELATALAPMLAKGYLAGTSVYVCTEHTLEVVANYFEALDPVFALVKECEDGRDVISLLEGPVCHGSFKRLN